MTEPGEPQGPGELTGSAGASAQAHELSPAGPADDLATGEGRLPALAVAAAGGAGTMLVELSAVRLISPWFGTSLVVWTNVIGVVLLSLAVGYLLGARLARGNRPHASLATVLAAAAVAAALSPALAAPACNLFMPRGVALHEAAALLAWGSLAASLCLFLPSALLLGCVAPLCVETYQRRGGGHAGTAGGLVLAASTLGSLVGTFGTSLWLVPMLGIASTFLVGTALLGTASLIAWFSFGPPRRAPAMVLLALAGGAAPFAQLQTPSPAQGTRILESEESAYQTVRAVEDERIEPALRYLEVNEFSDSFQSVWQVEPGLLPERFYYNSFALPAWWSHAEPQSKSGPWRTLVLGLGAGTTWRVLGGALPPGVELDSDGVELDPVVVELAQRHLELSPGTSALRVHSGFDARAFLALETPRQYDQIVVDTYANQIEIPPHLSTVEFFQELNGRLEVGGWLTVNVGSFALDDPVLVAIAETLAQALGQRVLAVRVPLARNHVLFARRDAEPPEPGSAQWKLLDWDPAQTGSDAPGTWAPLRELLAPLAIPGMTAWFDVPSRAPLSDDRNPIEQLQRRSIQLAARGGA